MRGTILALVVLLSISATSAIFFNTPCPPNCAQSSCTRIGCTRCQSNYCVKVYNGVGVCAYSCGSGAFCNPVGWCNDCDDSNCEQCSSKYECTRCKSRYTLYNGSCRRDFG